MWVGKPWSCVATSSTEITRWVNDTLRDGPTPRSIEHARFRRDNNKVRRHCWRLITRITNKSNSCQISNTLYYIFKVLSKKYVRLATFLADKRRTVKFLEFPGQICCGIDYQPMNSWVRRCQITLLLVCFFSLRKSGRSDKHAGPLGRTIQRPVDPDKSERWRERRDRWPCVGHPTASQTGFVPSQFVEYCCGCDHFER